MFALRDLGRAARELVELWLPPACPLCSRLLPPGRPRGFCPPCRAGMPPLDPPRCSRCALPFATIGGTDHLCGTCLQERDPPLDRVLAAGRYDGTLAEAIRRFKYSGTIGLDRPLAELMFPVLAAAEGELLVPVPLHPSRLRQRTYNQSLLLARLLGRHLRRPVAEDLLLRIRPTPPQQGLPAAVRRRNLRGAFALAGEVEGRRVLLVDDVLTTGSTARECARVLRSGGAAAVTAVVAARAGPPPAVCQNARKC